MVTVPRHKRHTKAVGGLEIVNIQANFLIARMQLCQPERQDNGVNRHVGL